MRRASPTSAPKLINWSGRRMKTTLPYFQHRLRIQRTHTSRLFPNWGRINTRATGANDSYHSLQVEASHRLQHGLEFHSGFTWAKNLADNQGHRTGHRFRRRRWRTALHLRPHRRRRLRQRCTEPAGCAGTPPCCTTCPFGRGKQFGAT